MIGFYFSSRIIDIGICVDPPGKESANIFEYTITKLKDVKCNTNSAIYSLINSEGDPAGDLTIINDNNTNSNGKRFVSDVQSAYFASRNTRLDCVGCVKLNNNRTSRKLEANIRLATPLLKSNALVKRGM